MNYNNIKRTKKQDLRQLKNLIYCICKGEIPFAWSEKERCWNMLPDTKAVGYADINVYSTFQWEPLPPKRDKECRSIQNQLQWFRNLAEKNSVSLQNVFTAAQLICDKQQWRFIRLANGREMLIEPNQKGNSRYNKKLNGKILDRLSEFGAYDLDCCFVTQTCDPAMYANKADAWENFYNKEVVPVWEPLRKHYGAIKVSVMESTKLGYPHIHNLFFFPKGKFPELAKLKNGTKLKYGKLYSFIKSRVHSRVFDIKTVSGKHKIFYLNKYLKKGIETPIRDILHKGLKNLTSSDIKLLNEFVYLTAFNKRKVLMSQSKAKKRASKVTALNASVLGKSCNEVAALSATKLRALLNSLCDNSPLINTSISWGVPYRGLIKEIERAKFRKDVTTGQFFRHFEEIAQNKTNTENFYTLLTKFVNNHAGAALNKLFYAPNRPEKTAYFTDFYNLNNDEDYIKCIKDLVIHYWQHCIKDEVPIKRVVEDYGEVKFHDMSMNISENNSYMLEEVFAIKSHQSKFLKQKPCSLGVNVSELKNRTNINCGLFVPLVKERHVEKNMEFSF